MTELVFKVLGSALGVWESKEKTKYQDRFIYLEKAYYEESNKDRPDDAVLDRLRFDIRLLCDSFCAQIGKPDAPNPPK